jgi:hypothetical protein
LVITSTHDDHHSATQTNASTENTHNNKSILSMQDLVILHANNIFPQNNKYDFKAYKHLHGIDMQIHSIPKPPKQKAQYMGLSDLHEEEFKLLAMEYNTTKTEPDNELDHYVNTLQRSNEDYGPGINGMFLNNLDPIFYAMQMQNPDVLTHAQINRGTKTRNPRVNGHEHLRMHPPNQTTSKKQVSRPDLDIKTKTSSRWIFK